MDPTYDLIISCCSTANTFYCRQRTHLFFAYEEKPSRRENPYRMQNRLWTFRHNSNRFYCWHSREAFPCRRWPPQVLLSCHDSIKHKPKRESIKKTKEKKSYGYLPCLDKNNRNPRFLTRPMQCKRTKYFSIWI